MANTSCSEDARRLLECCLRGERRPPGLVRALAENCPEELFRVVVENLADRFDAALCDTYAEMMSEAISCAVPGVDRVELVERYRRVRKVRRAAAEPAVVYVLSRVTLGADVAVTSVLLDAVKRRYPGAAIRLVGPAKNHELFACDPRIGLEAVPYRRGTLAERLAPWPGLRRIAAREDAIVVDTDSRLTQLGLLPVCPEERYFLFESRSYGGDSDAPLPALARRWAEETFGIPDASPYVAVPEPAGRADIAVSLGVGENPAKRVPDPFEEQLLRLLAARGGTVWIDRGAGGEEAQRVERALAGCGAPRDRFCTWEGSFAGFASIISRAGLYVGYDSAGQHVAAACGVPLVSIFAGFPVPRMFHRWRPAGTVIRVDHPDPEAALAEVGRALR